MNKHNIKVHEEKSKVRPIFHDSKAIFDRYKRATKLPKKNYVKRIHDIQKEYLKNPYYGFQKRTFDIIISLGVTLLILSWLYPLLFVLIKLESKGPAIFKQKRNGLHMDPFNCYKFRSMRINEFCDSIPVTDANDYRITNLGKFLRKYSLDELPQFLNVLKGEMTVVGPRPHMVSETNTFIEISQDFHKRHDVKPGITGLAQINNCRGYIGSIGHLSSRIKYDLFYIRNASLRFDIIIVYKTIIQMFFGRSKGH
ncbi:MAG: sugar transferase [Flavobacteriaceae bacterium]|nr:MAG: sugar transferase [Flavobacteriaceae bacterium]